MPLCLVSRRAARASFPEVLPGSTATQPRLVERTHVASNVPVERSALFDPQIDDDPHRRVRGCILHAAALCRRSSVSNVDDQVRARICVERPLDARAGDELPPTAFIHRGYADHALMYCGDMKVSAGCSVRIEVELKVKGGDVIESSKKSGPVEYRHGSGQMLAGLEKELEGVEAGAEKSGVLSPKDAFGTDDTQPTMKVSRSEFPKDATIAAGDRFEAKGPTGVPVVLRVTEVDEKVVSAQVVHPLAGKEIEFSVKVLSVKPPLPKAAAIEEIEPDPESKK
jgi:FKBP-type peptidyl-prolyl cis-trans isomerase SlyD